jgi:hypothetical protein
MEAKMPGDPQKCRERALKCKYLANDAQTEPAKQMFLDLAQSWLQLAAELEDTNTLLNALSEMKFEDVLEESIFDETDEPQSSLKAQLPPIM